MKLNLKRGAALVLSASMTLQAPVPAFAKVSGHSANPAAYSTSASSEAQLTGGHGQPEQRGCRNFRTGSDIHRHRRRDFRSRLDRDRGADLGRPA